MKIVQVQTQAEAAGAQRISDMLGECLRSRGHDVRTVFMYRKTDVYDQDPFADFVLAQRPRGLAGQIQASLGLFAYLRAARPDAVISFQHFGNIFGTIGGRLAGARHLVANQSGAPQQRGVLGLTSWIDKQMGRLGLFDVSIVNSAWTEAQFAGYPPAYQRRIRRIDHGVPSAAKSYDKLAARAAFGLPPDAFLIVTTGRQTRQKNQIVLVNALSGIPQAHLALAGVGPERESLVAAARRGGVLDRIHFVGEISPARVPEFLAAGDVFAFPSNFETFGLSVVEAAIAGLPVVASDIAVLQEVLTDDDREPSALFARPEDADGFAAAITTIMEQPQLAEKLSQAGRRLAERYSPTKMCLAYEALLTTP
ncbi:MAG: glycosyltransferase family 4 protein [Devosia sp.]|nr:glycosyltransferase family 4 protein [Devosia sp.]